MQKKDSIFNKVVIISALGYFVDVFDLILFGMVRVTSLKSIGITEPSKIESVGMMIDNFQMFGMLLGGLLWGIIGDKKGRLYVLFGSILTYSIANIANGFILTEEWYAFWRFVAGLGLAGELGAAITLVTEVLSKEKRGLGTSFVAGVGVLGAVFGAIFIKTIGLENWRIAYIIGGIMGLILLVLRFNISESKIFENNKSNSIERGNFFILFKKERFITYFSLILVALPIWYIIQLYAKFSPELVTALNITVEDNTVIATNSIMYIYLGLSFGDISSGFISNLIKSRKKTLLIFLSLMLFLIGIFWNIGITNISTFYILIFCLGFSGGYWSIFVTVAAEHFGTNIRSTVTNTAPNFVRGFVVVINSVYLFLKNNEILKLDTIQANILVGLIVFSFSFFALKNLKETFGKDLDYNETN
ncbi:MAG: MFS transporter [Solirubrobacteraceae bacterium]